jgi:thioesterase domain-containing protein
VGIDDDFFELGGHSMLAVRMLTQVEARLGERVRLAAMVRSPTIRGLAEGMAAPAATDKWRALVEMKPDGSRPPLFLIHSLTGDVLLYRDLVRRLVPEQPAWGLEAIGADGRQLPLLAIPDMARHYIEEMRSVQPQGPYHLAGLCYGGAVAHEMAHQLEQGGERVAFVGLIEAAPLGLRQKTTLPMRVGKHVHELRELAAGERVQFLRSTGLNVVDRVKKQARWRVKKHLYMERGRALPPGLTDMIELNFVAAVGYVSPQYGGRVTLFRVYDPAKGENVEDTRQRWREFAAGGLDVRNVISAGADRISVLFEPHVAALGAELEAALQEVLEEAAP